MATDDAAPANDSAPLLEFLYRLGQAFLAAGEQTAKVELILRRVAAANGARRARVVVFPTALFVILHDGAHERVTLAEGPTQVLRLDQIADLYTLGDAAQRGDLAPATGIERLAEILRQRPRFGVGGILAGHTILALGLAIILKATWLNLAAAAVLGTLVGALKTLNRDRPVLAVPLPVVAAGMVSALVFFGINTGLPLEPLYALVPPLVELLPGAMLTLGMVELAYGDMVSGSSRLVTGIVQLVLLAFGLVAGAALVGVSREALADATPELTAAPWTAWAGVVVFGAGAYLHFSAPRNSFWWMLLVLLLAFAAQQLATAVIGKEISGFFGMLVATPLGYLIQLRFRGPPAIVTFLPTFWLLVPGALGLVSIKYMLSDRAAGVEGMVSAVFAIVAIALGTLMGASIYKGITERLDWWQLQLGRVGRWFRPS